MGAEVEIDHHSRIWLRRRRQGDQSAERLLRREVDARARPPIWSIWDPASGLGYLPRRDDTIQALALAGGLRILERRRQQRDRRRPCRCCNGRSAASGTGTRGRSRPFRSTARRGATPATGQQGDWIERLRDIAAAAGAEPAADAAALCRPSRRWRRSAGRPTSGRSSRPWSPSTSRAARRATQRFANPYFDIELTYEVLRSAAAHAELQAIAGFFAETSGEDEPFWVAPPGLSAVAGQAIGTGDGSTTIFPLVALDRRLHASRSTGRRASRPSISTASRRRAAGASSAAMRRRSPSRPRRRRASRSRPTSASSGSAASPTTCRISRNS